MIPTVEVLEDEFDFGKTYIGSACKLPLTLSNATGVPAKVQIDLTQHPEFQVTLSLKGPNP